MRYLEYFLLLAFCVLDVVEPFTSLLIPPLMYDIAMKITQSRHRRVRYNLWLVPLLIAGMLNAVVYDILLFAEVVMLGYMLVYLMLRYRRSIESYYVDVQFTDYRHVMTIMRTMVLCVFILYLEHLIQRGHEYPVVDVVCLLVLMSLMGIIGRHLWQIEGSTVVLNLKETNFTNQEIVEMTEKERTEVTEAIETNASSLYIEDVIGKWVKSPGCSYLKEGITINQVADEMRISPRALSAHLNTAMQQNFNSWINGLRIEEAKHLFRQDAELSASYVALKCGFADAAMLSKNFKRVTGMTITEYKKVRG